MIRHLGGHMGTLANESALAFFDLIPCIKPHAYTIDNRNLPAPTNRIGMMVEGEGDFYLDTETIHISPGEMVFIPAGSTYVSAWTPAPVVNFYTLCFLFHDSRFFFHRKKCALQKLTFPEHSDMLNRFADGLAAWQKGKPGWYQTLAFFYDLLSQITPLLQATDTPDFDPRIETAILYIEKHYREDFSIDTLAEHCHMSTSHFYTLFRQYTGCSPIAYKQKISISRAKLLLVSEPHMSIEAVSEEAGYHSAIYFREIFKKCNGITPSQYRKRQMQEM